MSLFTFGEFSFREFLSCGFVSKYVHYIYFHLFCLHSVYSIFKVHFFVCCEAALKPVFSGCQEARHTARHHRQGLLSPRPHLSIEAGPSLVHPSPAEKGVGPAEDWPPSFYRLDTSVVSIACPLSCPLSKRNAAASHGKGKTKKVQKNKKKLAKYLVGSKKVATFAPAKQKCRHP